MDAGCQFKRQASKIGYVNQSGELLQLIVKTLHATSLPVAARNTNNAKILRKIPAHYSNGYRNNVSQTVVRFQPDNSLLAITDAFRYILSGNMERSAAVKIPLYPTHHSIRGKRHRVPSS